MNCDARHLIKKTRCILDPYHHAPHWGPDELGVYQQWRQNDPYSVAGSRHSEPLDQSTVDHAIDQ